MISNSWRDFACAFLISVNLRQTGVTKEEATLIEDLPPSDWTCEHGYGEIFFIHDWHWLTYSIVGSGIPRQAGLGCIRKTTALSRGSKVVNSLHLYLCFSSCLGGPLWLCAITHNPTKSISPQVGFHQCFNRRPEKKLRCPQTALPSFLSSLDTPS